MNDNSSLQNVYNWGKIYSSPLQRWKDLYPQYLENGKWKQICIRCNKNTEKVSRWCALSLLGSGYFFRNFVIRSTRATVPCSSSALVASVIGLLMLLATSVKDRIRDECKSVMLVFP